MDLDQHERDWLKETGALMAAGLGVKKGQKVIDFGSGKGRYTIPLTQVVGENGFVWSVEMESNEINILKERSALFAGPATLTILNEKENALASLKENSVDHIFAFDVLQYINDWKSLFISFRRILKIGGYVHIYPAAIPHPGSVDIEDVKVKMKKSGLTYQNETLLTMMHNKDMVDDRVYTFH